MIRQSSVTEDLERTATDNESSKYNISIAWDPDTVADVGWLSLQAGDVRDIKNFQLRDFNCNALKKGSTSIKNSEVSGTWKDSSVTENVDPDISISDIDPNDTCISDVDPNDISISDVDPNDTSISDVDPNDDDGTVRFVEESSETKAAAQLNLSVVDTLDIRKVNQEKPRMNCPVCYKEFVSLIDFQSHQLKCRKVKSSSKKECPTCGQLVSSRNFARHFKTHSVPKSSCPHCNRLISSKFLVEHIPSCQVVIAKKQEKKMNVQCPICSISIGRNSLKRHMKFKHPSLNLGETQVVEKVDRSFLTSSSSEAVTSEELSSKKAFLQVGARRNNQKGSNICKEEKLQAKLLESRFKERLGDDLVKNLETTKEYVDEQISDDHLISLEKVQAELLEHRLEEEVDNLETVKDNINIDNLPSFEKKHACNVCGFRARVFNTLKIHTEMHHIQLRFHCKFCSLNTKERYALKSHLKTKHGVSLEDSYKHTVYECGICFLKGSKEEFESHIGVSHSTFMHIFMKSQRKRGRRKANKQAICEYCGDDFSGRKCAAALLRSHVEIAHMKFKCKCVLCGYEGGLKQYVYDHIEEKHLPLNFDSREKKQFKRNNTRYRCYICSLITDSDHDILEHMKSEHPNELKLRCVRRTRKTRNYVDTRRMHECPHCDYKSNVFQNLKNHIETHIDSIFSCKICDVKRKRRSRLVHHIQREHKIFKALSQRNMSCFCKDCNFIGSCKDYDEHLEENHQMPKSNKKLRENKLSSAEPKRKINYQCGKCDKRYITKISLKQHIAMKHLETMYSCGVCDQTYRKVLEIKEHMTSVHPEKRDMVTTYCGECQTDFPNDLNYKHLMRVHRALYTRKHSSFICDVCDFPSRNKQCLTDHYKTHHPEYKFCKCKLCGFESSHYPALWRHHREVHEQFTHFKCKICCAIFKRNENLQLHIENMHKLVEESEKENYCDKNLQDHGTGYDELQEQASAGEGGEKAGGLRSVGAGE